MSPWAGLYILRRDNDATQHSSEKKYTQSDQPRGGNEFKGLIFRAVDAEEPCPDATVSGQILSAVSTTTDDALPSYLQLLARLPSAST